MRMVIYRAPCRYLRTFKHELGDVGKGGRIIRDHNTNILATAQLIRPRSADRRAIRIISTRVVFMERVGSAKHRRPHRTGMCGEP